MPAERAGPGPGGQGKAIPVEQTAGQLRLLIATAENPKGAARRAPADRSAVVEVRVPEAIVNVENVTPVTMEEVVSRLSAALVKVVSNKGVPGSDGQTVGELLEQWPIAGPRLAARLLEGMYRVGFENSIPAAAWGAWGPSRAAAPVAWRASSRLLAGRCV